MRIRRYDPIAAAAVWRRRLNSLDPYALAVARACEEWKREQARKRHVKPMYLNYGRKIEDQDEW